MAVTVDDVGVTLRRKITDPLEVAAVEQWIRDVSMLIRARYGARVADLEPEAVDYVIRESVAAMARTPDASTRSTVAVDDATVTREYKTSVGRAWVGDDLWAWLDGLLPDGGARDAFSIRLASSPSPAPGSWGCRAW